MQDITKKIEKAEDNFKESPEFSSSVIGIVANTLEGSSHPPDPNMYYWACQRLIDFKGLKFQINELDGKQEVQFAVDIPGQSDLVFKKICFTEQVHEINNTPIRADEELQSVTRQFADKGGKAEPPSSLELEDKLDTAGVTDEPSKPISKKAIEDTNTKKSQHERFVKLKDKLRYDKKSGQEWLTINNAFEVISAVVMSVHDIPNMLGKEQVKVKGQEQETERKRF
jgi:hypothetical protein